MSLWNLDPRQAGVTEPDAFCVRALAKWRCYREGEGAEDLSVLLGDGPTEAAALQAAREASGFGHVAEQPCAKYRLELPSGHFRRTAEQRARDVECRDCAWPRDRHGKER